MNSKYLFTAIAVVIVAIIALFIYNNKNKTDVASQTNSATNMNTEQQNNSNEAMANTNATINTNTSEQTNTPDGNNVAVFEVAYDGKAYSPSQLKIKNGDVVVFKNESTESFWPASAPHPTHTIYPEFDPKKSYGPGTSWQFKFSKVGSWSYHDHLNPSAFGKIMVE